MRTVRVFTCYDSFQAQIIQGALENEGITSVLHNIHTSDVLRGFEASFTEIDILVYEDDYEKARTLLKKNQMIPEDLKYCPYCHSDDIKLTVRNGKRIGLYFQPCCLCWQQLLRAPITGNMCVITAKNILTYPHQNQTDSA